MPGPRRGLASSGLDTVIPQPSIPNGDNDPTQPTRATGDNEPAGETSTATVAGPADPSPRTPPPTAAAGEPRKEKIAGYVSADLADDARNTVSALGSHVDDPQSLSELLESAIRREVLRLQTERNDGEPFPPRVRRSLPVGRRPE